MITGDRDSSRQVFINTWHKHSTGQVLEPLENIVLGVILQHPRFHAILDDPGNLRRDYNTPDGENPFLHMGLHIALAEQIGTNRPPGITTLYQDLARHCTDEHHLQHRLMTCLEEALWSAQGQGGLPDEGQYLDCIRGLKP